MSSVTVEFVEPPTSTPCTGEMRAYLDEIHTKAAAAWDRDVRLPTRGEIRIETGDLVPGVLACLLVDGERLYRLFSAPDDHELGVRWIPWTGEGGSDRYHHFLVQQIRDEATRRGRDIHYRPLALPPQSPCGKIFAELAPYEFTVQPDLVTCVPCSRAAWREG